MRQPKNVRILVQEKNRREANLEGFLMKYLSLFHISDARLYKSVIKKTNITIRKQW